MVCGLWLVKLALALDARAGIGALRYTAAMTFLIEMSGDSLVMFERVCKEPQSPPSTGYQQKRPGTARSECLRKLSRFISPVSREVRIFIFMEVLHRIRILP